MVKLFKQTIMKYKFLKMLVIAKQFANCELGEQYITKILTTLLIIWGIDLVLLIIGLLCK